ncbi:MAG: DPP IV N-terminal domain-containing protein, partial [Saprospiraceae bacterium]|nr:DPP IV N-terminal domain-containing protein [Saprospiraceae bacterium]
MKRIILLSTLFLLILGIHSAYTQKAPAFSYLDLFDLEWISDPQISPDGEKIVYIRRSMDVMKDRRQSRLWMINADGTGHIKLTDHELSESSPSWSPDGSRIAFRASTDEGSEIFIYWVESGRTAKISQLERSPGALSWSPDGKWLAFSMLVPESEPRLVTPPPRPEGAQWAEAPTVITRLKHEADGAGYLEPGYDHLFVIPAEGGAARRVTSGNYNHNGNPAWSKDGKRLFFSANRHEDWEYDRRNLEVYSVPVAGGEIQALTDREGPDFDPVLSPDGQQIAYLGYDDLVQTYQIVKLYVMNTDGTGKRVIETTLDRSMSDIVWDEEGGGLYFQYDDRGNTKVGHVTLEGKVTTLAHDLGGTAMGRPYGGGSFSVSAGGRIAYTHTDPYHPAELAVLDKGASNIRLITQLNGEILPHRTLGKLEEIWYKSSVDGRDIQGWIVKPP